jgi:hypothetical protein
MVLASHLGYAVHTSHILCASVLFAVVLGRHLLGLLVVVLWLLRHVGLLWPVSFSVSDVTHKSHYPLQ